MIWLFDLLLLLLVLATAVVALQMRDLISAAIVFGAFSFIMCLLYAGMGAVDVAFTEAAVGAGVSTVLFLAMTLHTSRRSRD